jgi:ketosteroid isomerase-like protein
MVERSHSRRTILSGIAGVGAGSAIGQPASAQSSMAINDPSVVQEIEALFASYDRALRGNDLPTLNGFFLDSPLTVRFGNQENLYGIDEIQAYRASVSTGPNVIREETVITTYGNDVAIVAARNRPVAGRVGRTMQTWIRFPHGWRIVAAHVSTMDE